MYPAVSPDGKLAAFAPDRSGEGHLDIYVQQRHEADREHAGEFRSIETEHPMSQPYRAGRGQGCGRGVHEGDAPSVGREARAGAA